MLNLFKLITAVLLLFCGLLGAQPLQQTHDNPDCQFFFTLTHTGMSSPAPNFDNRQQGCTTWSVVYNVSGFSAVNVTLETATAAAPATFATGFPVQQAIITGANPGVTTPGGFLWIVGMNAWVRVKLTSSTGAGVVTGSAYGWRIPNAGQ